MLNDGLTLSLDTARFQGQGHAFNIDQMSDVIGQGQGHQVKVSSSKVSVKRRSYVVVRYNKVSRSRSRAQHWPMSEMLDTVVVSRKRWSRSSSRSRSREFKVSSGSPVYSRRPSADDALKTSSMSVKVDRELVTRLSNSRNERENDGK